jgi:hypothetical protein
MNVIGQLHAQASLFPVHIGQEAGWVSESIWTRWQREKNEVLEAVSFGISPSVITMCSV